VGVWPISPLYTVPYSNKCLVTFYSARNLASAECIHFRARSDGVHAFAYNSAKSEPIWIKSGALLIHCLGLALADFDCDSRSSESCRARRNFVFFCQIINARFYRFPVGQFSRNLNTTCRSVWRWIHSQQNFEIFPYERGRFFPKKMQRLIFFNALRLHDAITPQWIEIDGNSLLNDPSTGCLVSIFTARAMLALQALY